jgi:light-regulated signal transduction histidine kinase (bacteriophytochrome)
VAVTGSSKAVIAEVKEVIAPQKTSEVKALTDLLSRVSNKVEKTIVKTVNLPKKTPTTESAMSLAPEMCSVSGLVVTSLKKGLCTVAYTVTGSSNIPFTIEKTFNFTK